MAIYTMTSWHCNFEHSAVHVFIFTFH